MVTSSSIPTKAEIDQLLGLGLAAEVFAPSSYHDMNMTAVIDELVGENNTKSIASLVPSDQSPYDALQAIQALLHSDILPHNTNGTAHAVAYGVMTILATIFVAIRIYSRKHITKKIRIEDWTAVAAMVFVVGLTVLNIMEAIEGYGNAGVHIWDLSVNQVRFLMMLFFPNEILFVMAHFFVKFTFIIFYYNMTPSRVYRRWIIAVGVYVIGITLAGIIGTPLQCQPVDEWNHLLTAKCFDKLTAFTLNGVMYILADIFILVLPVPAVLKLQLRLRDKLTILAMFCAGAFVCAISIIRLKMLRVWLETVDFTYEVNAHDPWVFVELDLSMIISCLPALYKSILQKRREGGLGINLPLAMTSGNYGQKRRKVKTRDTEIIAAAMEPTDSKTGRAGSKEITYIEDKSVEEV